ncbi:MAG: multiheme c-type cytochrome, partial [Rhodospirillaceae bacterium]|nr:multiheme c-type cytochrome [Rhodospirillaceae bacterium]
MAAALIIALVSAFAFSGDGTTALSSVNPGPLSGGHQNFTAEEGCATCHQQHSGDAGMWLQASWSPGTLSKSCESCHTFSGPATSPHNETFQTAGGKRTTECTMCHTEHKGADAQITQLSDSQCNACHEKQFNNFSDGHPSFSEDYPSRRRTAIVFDHTNHFSKHFQDARFETRAPKDRCISCHNVDQAARHVPVRSFEESCARCHENQIAGREFVLFTLPEFEVNPFDAAVVGEACGPTAEAREAAGEQ